MQPFPIGLGEGGKLRSSCFKSFPLLLSIPTRSFCFALGAEKNKKIKKKAMVTAGIQSKGNTEVIKFLCSYGGKILPRPTDGKLRYVGGLTRVLAVDRSVSHAELMVKLVEFCGFSVTLKCQLPDADLDTLISIKSDEDLANILEEYDRCASGSKIRAILSPPKSLKQTSPPTSVDLSPKSPFSVCSPPVSYCGCSPRTSSPSAVYGRYRSPPPLPPQKYPVVSCQQRCCEPRCHHHHIQRSPCTVYYGASCRNYLH